MGSFAADDDVSAATDPTHVGLSVILRHQQRTAKHRLGYGRRVADNVPPLPDFTRWPSFPFEGDLRVKKLAPAVEVEPPRVGEDAADCVACNTADDLYIWVSERWRVRAMDQPTGLPVVLVLECRSHLDLGDLPNLLAAELGVMTVRLERAIRSLDGVARVHVNRWGDGSAHLHMWFLARPYGRLQLRGTFLSLWDDILPVTPEVEWRESLGLVAAWLAEFGGQAIAEPPHIAWESPGTVDERQARAAAAGPAVRPTDLADLEGSSRIIPAARQADGRLEADGPDEPANHEPDVPESVIEPVQPGGPVDDPVDDHAPGPPPADQRVKESHSDQEPLRGDSTGSESARPSP